MEILFGDVQEVKIFKPKARRLIPNKKQCKSKTSSNHNIYTYYWNNKGEQKSLNLESITSEEINEDFKTLNMKLEQEIFYNEIQSIISLSKIKNQKPSNHNSTKSRRGKKSEKRNIL